MWPFKSVLAYELKRENELLSDELAAANRMIADLRVALKLRVDQVLDMQRETAEFRERVARLTEQVEAMLAQCAPSEHIEDPGP